MAYDGTNIETETDPDKQLAKRVLRYVQRAEIDRNRHITRIQDCYKYGMPWRHQPDQNQPIDQLDEIFDGELMTVLEDFAADMLNTFTPQKAEWVEPKPVETFDKGQLKQLAEPLANHKRVIFAEMARSNLYQALQEAYLDLGPGTMALIITDIDPAQPIHCEATPIVDLLLNRGPYGRLDGKWRKVKRLGKDIPVLWPNAKPLPGKDGWDMEDCTEYEVIDGVYRDHQARADETWHYTVLANGTVIFKETYKGQGSNPFIVARWARDATTAWGMGPTYRTIPETKTLNHLRYVSLKNYDRTVDPPMSYEDDGAINFEHGINPGDFVPRAVGSKAPEPMESGREINIEVFQVDEVRSAIRKAHYQDRPEQLGKTPPTATQWADERAERARRMGTPATNLVQELAYPLYRRFAYLLEKRGKLPKIVLNGDVVALEPVSPLLRAQEQEEVTRMDKFMEMLTARLGPEMANIVVDGFKYAERLGMKMGIDTGILRPPEQLQQTVQQLGPILGGGGMDYNPGQQQTA